MPWGWVFGALKTQQHFPGLSCSLTLSFDIAPAPPHKESTVASDLQRGFYLTAAEAVTWGLADRVLGPAPGKHQASGSRQQAARAGAGAPSEGASKEGDSTGGGTCGDGGEAPNRFGAFVSHSLVRITS